MRRSTPFFCMVALLVGAPSLVFAQGEGKGVIERLSGPGPFHGLDTFGPVGCITNEKELKPFWDCYRRLNENENENENNEPTWWLDFEIGFYESEDDPLVNNSEVELTKWEVRASTFVGSTRDSVEVGFGAGAYHFSGDFESFEKLALPVRVGFFPFKIGWERPWTTVFSVWVKQTFLAGRISGGDFGVPEVSFDENWEGVTSYGFQFDARYFIAKLFK